MKTEAYISYHQHRLKLLDYKSQMIGCERFVTKQPNFSDVCDMNKQLDLTIGSSDEELQVLYNIHTKLHQIENEVEKTLKNESKEAKETIMELENILQDFGKKLQKKFPNDFQVL